jgi:hypothetical protein
VGVFMTGTTYRTSFSWQQRNSNLASNCGNWFVFNICVMRFTFLTKVSRFICTVFFIIVRFKRFLKLFIHKVN